MNNCIGGIGRKGARAVIGLSCVIAVASVMARAAEDDAARARIAPAARLAVAPPPVKASSIESGRLAQSSRSFGSSVNTAERPIQPAKPLQLAAANERPALPASGALPPPGQPQFTQGPRRLVTPAAALVPRIPNLQIAPKRALPAQPNPGGAPALPITTAQVNDLDGSSKLPLLAPFTRDIAIEIAPPALPLAFDQAPYVQVPGAADDEDPPARLPEAAAGPHIE